LYFFRPVDPVFDEMLAPFEGWVSVVVGRRKTLDHGHALRGDATNRLSQRAGVLLKHYGCIGGAGHDVPSAKPRSRAIVGNDLQLQLLAANASHIQDTTTSPLRTEMEILS